MEEKKYPKHEDEEGVGMVNEPMAEAVVASPQTEEGATTVHDCIDDLDWDKFPSLGPFSEEEAIARIDKFEEELAKGEVKWIRIDDIHAELKKLHPWL